MGYRGELEKANYPACTEGVASLGNPLAVIPLTSGGAGCSPNGVYLAHCLGMLAAFTFNREDAVVEPFLCVLNGFVSDEIELTDIKMEAASPSHPRLWLKRYRSDCMTSRKVD